MAKPQRNRDHQIKESILEELAWTAGVNADRLDVAINEGVVTLSGQVQTYPEKDAAVRAALRVRGVTALADEVEVNNGWAPREDAELALDAEQVILHEVPLARGAVKATVHDRVVTLSGTVAWHYQRDAIRRHVIALPGVIGVQNSITLKPTHTMASPELAARNIKAALVRNAELDAEHVHVSAAGSQVTLTGQVSSWAERRQAEHAAWSTPGVTHVENDIAVNF